jgi:hypothetical protein
MKKLSLIVFLGALILAETSCRTSGYGCKGRETWGGMVKRINRP